MNIVFACPVCHHTLAGLHCPSCDVTYRDTDGTPSFVTRRMYPSDEAYEKALKVIDFWDNGWKKRLAGPELAHLYVASRDELKAFCDERVAYSQSEDAMMGFDLPMASLEGKQALNIGCGPGTEAMMLANSGASVVAMDITPNAARAAAYLIRKVGGDGVGIQADARFVPVETGTMDVVLSNGVLHHSPDIPKSIAEIHRVLKPGGKAYIMLYATWSVMFMQMRLMRKPGEDDWDTDDRTNPWTTTYSLRECRKLFSQFAGVQTRKTGGTIKHFSLVGKYMPESLDRALRPYLGCAIYIVAEKAGSS